MFRDRRGERSGLWYVRSLIRTLTTPCAEPKINSFLISLIESKMICDKCNSGRSETLISGRSRLHKTRSVPLSSCRYVLIYLMFTRCDGNKKFRFDFVTRNMGELCDSQNCMAYDDYHMQMIIFWNNNKETTVSYL